MVCSRFPLLHINMLNSYSRYKGRAVTSMENGSPEGVMIAESTNVMQKAYFLSPLRFSLVTTPMADNAATTVGNSNTMPKVSTIAVNIEM